MKTVVDSKIAKSIITSQDFITYSLADQYRELTRRTGTDFSAAVTLLDWLPVFMDGDEHQIIRKVMAKQISMTKECQFSSSRDKLDFVFEFTFRKDASLDLVCDFAVPLWRSISGSIVHRSESMLKFVDDIPGLFSPYLSMRERMSINDSIAQFLSAHKDDADDQLILLCLVSLGARPFVGTLALSLYEIFKNNPGSCMRDITWPEAFPVSSLRYVDRICVNDSSIGEMIFEAGDRVRCFTQSKEYSVNENTRALFGFGAHTCLGKAISEKVWRLVVEKFSQSDLRVKCLDIAMSPHDEPFFMPSHMNISLT